MPDFRKRPFATPIPRNVFLRSTVGYKTESYTFAHDSLPSVMIDGYEQKILQPGMVIAKITSGPDTGKVGAFQAAGSGADEVQTITEGTAITAGTFTITLFPGTAGEVTTAPIAHDATTAAAQVAVREAVAESGDLDYAGLADDIAVTGNAFGSGAGVVWTVTYNGSYGLDIPQLTVDATDLTGTVTVATTTPGVVGAIDGRGNAANIVGINNTFLPWQLMERDVEIAVIYDAAVYQDKCLELNAAGVSIPLSNTTRDAMDVTTGMHFTFHTYNTEI